MTELRTLELAGWGGFPRIESQILEPADLAELESARPTTAIMRGQGRSYGDAAISGSGVVILSDRLNRIISFEEGGVLKAEAGTTIDEILRLFVAEGWFPMVVPGTKFVSLGGCLAADVHGKNHHRDGSFAEHVDEVEILLADRTHRVCSPSENAELFWATAGGMGLTGIITKVRLRLRPVESALMMVQHHQAPDLDSSLRLLEDKTFDDEYSVVWLDCLAKGSRLGRSVLIRGHHATVDELPEKSRSLQLEAGRSVNLKLDFPAWVLNPFSMAAFNQAYYLSKGFRRRPFVQHYDRFFFPLDRIGNWNRMYGRRGFIQYQCVFPLKAAGKGIQLLLEALSSSGRASFLAVLKLFGPGNSGLLSFPIEGYTLTLDLPLTDPGLFSFLDSLDEIVLKFGGKVYLAKDARLKPDVFRAMYPRLNEWCAMKSRLDPLHKFASDLSRRLELGPPSPVLPV